MRHLTWIALGVLFVLGSAAHAQSADAICTARGGAFNDDDVCVITDTGDTYDITVQYPAEFVSEYPFTADTINDFVDSANATFITATEEIPQEGLPGPLTQIFFYDVFPYTGDITGIRFTVSEYLGGANPNAFVTTFTFDTEDEELLALDDLFRAGTDYLNVVAPLAEADLRETYGDALFEEGLQPVPENYENFNLTDDALVFTFDEYQVAPGAAGTPQAEVSLFQLENILVSGIIQYRKG